jgi:hypothetical protein
MKKLQWPIVLFLILAPLSLILYKLYGLNQSLLPVPRDDLWKIYINISPSGYTDENLSFPLPIRYEGAKVREIDILDPLKKHRVHKTSDGQIVVWSDFDFNKKLGYSAVVKLRPAKNKRVNKTNINPSILKKYLDVPSLSEEVNQLFSNLEEAILFQLDNKSEIVRKIYDYLEQEIQLKSSIHSVQEALISGKGSRIVQAKIFNLLLRRANIPSRIVVGLVLDEKQVKARKNLRLSYLNQVFLDGRWQTFSIAKKLYNKFPDNFVPLYLNYDRVESMLENQDITYKVYASRVQVTKFDKEGYGSLISKSNSLANIFNLYQLPLPLQNLFYSILLIPLGALMLAIARNIIGVPTFGIFTPVLLTLFFIEAGAVFGLIFFIVVVGLGFVERLVLDKFYLLAVPRLSIIMSLMIILLMVFAVFANHYFPSYALTITVFPIVIMTVIIERFSITLIESGVRNTLKTTLGTLVIAYLCFGIFSIHKLQILLFTYPELQLMIIAFLIMIGDYKGYRISELLRFKALIKGR